MCFIGDMPKKIVFPHSVRRILMLLAGLIAAVVFAANGVVCYAEESVADKEVSTDDYLSQSVEQAENAISDDTKEKMTDSSIDGTDISRLNIGNIFSLLWNDFTSAITEPVNLAGRLAAVLLLSALAKSIAPEKGGTTSAFMTISAIACITAEYQSVTAAFGEVCDYLDKLSEFMYSYIPIYASLTAASGSFSAGGSYYAGTLGICELIAVVSHKVIMPFLSVFLALSFTAAVNPDMKFSSAAESIKNAVRFVLTALMTIFTGLISIQTVSGAAADNAATRAVKLGASSFIPIIGGSVSEAYSSVYASVGVIKSSVGALGITVIFVMLCKPLVTLLCVKAVLTVSKIIADLLGLGESSELLKSTDYAMSAAISTILCFSLMFIAATAAVLMQVRG